MDRKRRMLMTFGLASVMLIMAGIGAWASSHREAPGITKTPKVDGTDFYIFNSYEVGRQDFVTMVANYLPLQDPYGGPNYFTLDPEARYEIKVENSGDAVADLIFRFEFENRPRNIALPIGPDGQQKTVAVPLINVGPITADDTGALNVIETYGITLLRRGHGGAMRAMPITNAQTHERTFVKPVDNIGQKSIADYAAYAAAHVYDIDIPGCDTAGRVFVGQRDDPFAVNLGEVFDLVNVANPIGDRDAELDIIDDANVTSLILEVSKSCLTGNGPTIGAWTTASLPRFRGAEGRPRAEVGNTFVQVSRLSAPLVNEIVIGLKDKDRFNASEPRDDAQFLDYVTHPTFPALLEALFGSAGVRAPTLFPRTDLVAAFLTGVDGLNRFGTPAEMMRLNTTIAAKPAAMQDSLGVLGGDLAGFPNGRRPGDDVVDIELRVAMGVLLDAGVAPSGSLPFTDGALVQATDFDDHFPYLTTPLPGSPSN